MTMNYIYKTIKTYYDSILPLTLLFNIAVAARIRFSTLTNIAINSVWARASILTRIWCTFINVCLTILIGISRLTHTSVAIVIYILCEQKMNINLEVLHQNFAISKFVGTKKKLPYKYNSKQPCGGHKMSPRLHLSVVIFFCSFRINGSNTFSNENWILLKPVLGSMGDVALFIIFHEQIQ